MHVTQHQSVTKTTRSQCMLSAEGSRGCHGNPTTMLVMKAHPETRSRAVCDRLDAGQTREVHHDDESEPDGSGGFFDFRCGVSGSLLHLVWQGLFFTKIARETLVLNGVCLVCFCGAKIDRMNTQLAFGKCVSKKERIFF